MKNKQDSIPGPHWTPLHIAVFIHYAVSLDDFPRLTPVAREYAQGLVRSGLLQERYPDQYPAEWEVTAKGKVYLAALCNLPLPVQRWEIPS